MPFCGCTCSLQLCKALPVSNVCFCLFELLPQLPEVSPMFPPDSFLEVLVFLEKKKLKCYLKHIQYNISLIGLFLVHYIIMFIQES